MRRIYKAHFCATSIKDMPDCYCRFMWMVKAHGKVNLRGVLLLSNTAEQSAVQPATKHYCPLRGVSTNQFS